MHTIESNDDPKQAAKDPTKDATQTYDANGNPKQAAKESTKDATQTNECFWIATCEHFNRLGFRGPKF